MRNQTPAELMEYRLRIYIPSDMCSGMLPLEAADMIRDLARERDAADARVKILEAEQAAMTADRNRLADKLRTINALLEPQAWAEGSRNRMLIMAALHGVEVKV